ncbi:hypothetical protein STCU_11519 [Strigomonas culicis]|uniref:Endonuclease/exonuclease/phosphatase domain-containing protein n=1 Tax=Strigomonas culicis TaxID=28005 RepID=S9V071_9TRYP|nr:hypothetical protein STCU_11519 [Strigomonas culicis]|eukprot:EPY16150.1 hypothetical protein STCU_11519 [Strigomonas culicis]
MFDRLAEKFGRGGSDKKKTGKEKVYIVPRVSVVEDFVPTPVSIRTWEQEQQARREAVQRPEVFFVPQTSEASTAGTTAAVACHAMLDLTAGASGGASLRSIPCGLSSSSSGSDDQPFVRPPSLFCANTGKPAHARAGGAAATAPAVPLDPTYTRAMRLKADVRFPAPGEASTPAGPNDGTLLQRFLKSHMQRNTAPRDAADAKRAAGYTLTIEDRYRTPASIRDLNSAAEYNHHQLYVGTARRPIVTDFVQTPASVLYTGNYNYYYEDRHPLSATAAAKVIAAAAAMRRRHEEALVATATDAAASTAIAAAAIVGEAAVVAKRSPPPAQQQQQPRKTAPLPQGSMVLALNTEGLRQHRQQQQQVQSSTPQPPSRESSHSHSTRSSPEAVTGATVMSVAVDLRGEQPRRAPLSLLEVAALSPREARPAAEDDLDLLQLFEQDTPAAAAATPTPPEPQQETVKGKPAPSLFHRLLRGSREEPPPEPLSSVYPVGMPLERTAVVDRIEARRVAMENYLKEQDAAEAAAAARERQREEEETQLRAKLDALIAEEERARAAARVKVSLGGKGEAAAPPAPVDKPITLAWTRPAPEPQQLLLPPASPQPTPTVRWEVLSWNIKGDGKGSSAQKDYQAADAQLRQLAAANRQQLLQHQPVDTSKKKGEKVDPAALVPAVDFFAIQETRATTVDTLKHNISYLAENHYDGIITNNESAIFYNPKRWQPSQDKRHGGSGAWALLPFTSDRRDNGQQRQPGKVDHTKGMEMSVMDKNCFDNFWIRRVCMGVFKSTVDPNVKVAVVSYHAPHAQDHNKKENMKKFFDKLHELQQDPGSELFATPVVVCGDLNYDVRAAAASRRQQQIAHYTGQHPHNQYYLAPPQPPQQAAKEPAGAAAQQAPLALPPPALKPHELLAQRQRQAEEEEERRRAATHTDPAPSRALVPFGFFRRRAAAKEAAAAAAAATEDTEAALLPPSQAHGLNIINYREELKKDPIRVLGEVGTTIYVEGESDAAHARQHEENIRRAAPPSTALVTTTPPAAPQQQLKAPPPQPQPQQLLLPPPTPPVEVTTTNKLHDRHNGGLGLCLPENVVLAKPTGPLQRSNREIDYIVLMEADAEPEAAHPDRGEWNGLQDEQRKAAAKRRQQQKKKAEERRRHRATLTNPHKVVITKAERCERIKEFKTEKDHLPLHFVFEAQQAA